MSSDFFNARQPLIINGKNYSIFRLEALEKNNKVSINSLPFSLRILLEGLLRHYGEKGISEADVLNLATWKPVSDQRQTVPFFAGRVLMQDFTGVPVVVDLAAMRSAIQQIGMDPGEINPVVPVDLVIDHSVQVDFFARPDAIVRNAEVEFARNRERYELLHWAQKAFKNFNVVPPSTGIVHQVNLEYLAKVVLTMDGGESVIAYPDTLVGTDSHTTMINGLGVAGWGVGGIEAVSAMLGEPIEILTPDVIGFKLVGKLPEGVTPTDLTLTITQMLRQKKVVDKFVEFYGPGLSDLPLTDRAMIANMTPENGATMTFFPVDEQTLLYLRMTGRSEELISVVEAYTKEQFLFRTDQTPDPLFTDSVELNLSSIEPSLAGPKRPQDRVPLKMVKSNFKKALALAKNEGGYAIPAEDFDRKSVIKSNGDRSELRHGSVVIAAITSCTNTSNPFVMIGSGLLAKKAIEKGLKIKPYVKTSLAPGSRVVTEYLEQAGLMEPLSELGFALVGYGCTTCIGNSGPLSEEVVRGVNENNLVVAAVLSGNRNFEGRIHPNTQANYLASPPLVVAYALAGTVDIDLSNEPIGYDRSGKAVFLQEIWPTNQEIMETIRKNIKPEMFKSNYARVFTGNETWNKIEGKGQLLFDWDDDSTYIQEPPYFIGMGQKPPEVGDILGARVLAVFGDSITTDHISPAGSIAPASAAGKYLMEKGVKPVDFNSYGSRRGNDRVMTRGTFANIRLKNQILNGVEGSFTLHMPDNTQMSIYEAAMKYQQEGVPLVILAGKEYGTGSSRDWAAKGTLLLGVKAVIAESFERIHRSNLVGMGVLPLQFKPGQNAKNLGLTGHEIFYVENLQDHIARDSEIVVRSVKEDGSEVKFSVLVRLNTSNEVEYYRNGGILKTVLYNKNQQVS
jgi:aconitate hydratase